MSYFFFDFIDFCSSRLVMAGRVVSCVVIFIFDFQNLECLDLEKNACPIEIPQLSRLAYRIFREFVGPRY